MTTSFKIILSICMFTCITSHAITPSNTPGSSSDTGITPILQLPPSVQRAQPNLTATFSDLSMNTSPESTNPVIERGRARVRLELGTAPAQVIPVAPVRLGPQIDGNDQRLLNGAGDSDNIDDLTEDLVKNLETVSAPGPLHKRTGCTPKKMRDFRLGKLAKNLTPSILRNIQATLQTIRAHKDNHPDQSGYRALQQRAIESEARDLVKILTERVNR